MISRVRGQLVRRDAGAVEILTAGGVAYEIEIPLSVFERLPREGSELELRTVQVVREDAVALYGFLDAAERAVFVRLLSVSGFGPRLALNMLSTLTPERLVRAINDRDIAVLRQIPGLGTKKAERLVVELTDRLDDLVLTSDVPGARGGEAAIGALVALGYTPVQAAGAVRSALEVEARLEGVDLIKAALARLAT
jgi:Holliday junction DNA helicase RuvA